MIPNGLTNPEIEYIHRLSWQLPTGDALACSCDPCDGLIVQVWRKGAGVVAGVARKGEHLVLLDFNRCLGGMAGRYDAIEDVVNALWLSLAATSPGLRH